MESPLQVDDPGALYRVHCPTCRRNVWAGLEPPPGEGDDVLAEHDCPGPVDVEDPSGPPRRSLLTTDAAATQSGVPADQRYSHDR